MLLVSAEHYSSERIIYFHDLLSRSTAESKLDSSIVGIVYAADESVLCVMGGDAALHKFRRISCFSVITSNEYSACGKYHCRRPAIFTFSCFV